MPRNQFPFKVSTAKRLIGAVQRKGLTVKSVMAAPDGTLTVSIAPGESRDTSSELDKWLGEHPDAGQAQGHQ
jgi:hypothetical protein